MQLTSTACLLVPPPVEAIDMLSYQRASLMCLTWLHAGRQHYLDATVAYKRAVLNCVDYLSKFGYTKEQVRRNAQTTMLSLSATAMSSSGVHMDTFLQSARAHLAAHLPGET